MKSFFNVSDHNELIDRINKLRKETKGEWGKMTVSQMLAHCQVPLSVAIGETKLKRGLFGILFGRIAKKQLVKQEDFKKKNYPLHPALL